MKVNIEKLPKSEVKVSVELPWEDFEKNHDRALKKVQEVVEIDGFRKGHAPESEITKKYSDMIILEEMANGALDEIYPKILSENKLLPISTPKITVKKLARGNPFEAEIMIATYPEISLPDYKKIAKESTGIEIKDVTDAEVNEVIEELRKNKSGNHTHHHNHDGHDHSDHEEHDHNHDDAKDVKELPELNDEFAKSFGQGINTVEELKKKIRENLIHEKKHEASEKKRVSVMEKLLSETKAELSDVLVDQELSRMIGQMRADVSRFGGTWEDYLKHAGKTEEDLRRDWRKDAERRALTQLILSEIAEKEKITPSQDEIEVELVRLMSVVKDADEGRARGYLYQAISNEKVLSFLEKGGVKEEEKENK